MERLTSSGSGTNARTHTQYTRRETKFGEGRQKARESRAGPFECTCVWRLWVWHRRFILSSFSLIGRSVDQFNQSIERLNFHSTLQPPYIYTTQPKSTLRRRLRLRHLPRLCRCGLDRQGRQAQRDGGGHAGLRLRRPRRKPSLVPDQGLGRARRAGASSSREAVLSRLRH